MIHVNRPLLARIRPYVFVFDMQLAIALALLATLSMVTMYSAAIDYDGRMLSHTRNLALAFVVMWISASLPLPWIMGYDVEPLVTLESKRLLLRRAREEGWLLVFEHDPVVPWGRLDPADERPNLLPEHG